MLNYTKFYQSSYYHRASSSSEKLLWVPHFVDPPQVGVIDHQLCGIDNKYQQKSNYILTVVDLVDYMLQIALYTNMLPSSAN